MDIANDIQKLVMAGIGAVSLVAEKSAEALEILSKRGEEALHINKMDEGELRHNAEAGDGTWADVSPEVTADAIAELEARIRALPPEKRAELENKLARPTHKE